MKQAIHELLDDLDAIIAEYGQFSDTDVREAVGQCIDSALIAPQAGYQLPDDFQMLDVRGDAMVAGAMRRFLTHPESVTLANSCTTPPQRLAEFQDESVRSAKGSTLNSTIGLR